MEVMLLPFQALDQDKKGYLEPEELSNLMMQEGKANDCGPEFVWLEWFCLWQNPIVNCSFTYNKTHKSCQNRFFFNHRVYTGEAFTQDEMDEMLMSLCDQKKNLIYYKDVIGKLAIDTDM